LQNYLAGILAPLERICHSDRHELFTLSGLIPNFAMKPKEWRRSRADQIPAGHSSIQTTERYLGSEQNIAIAVNDNLRL
jgi:hypothetical protein